MTPEQVALVAKAERSIAAARTLAGDGHHDFAIARAYYAMFYLASALLLGEELAFSKHSAVIAAFGRHLVKTGRIEAEFHAFLREAQDQRNLGDYDTGALLGDAEAEEQIRRAEAFLAMAVPILRSEQQE